MQLCCTRDEGRPLGVGVQAQAPNHPLLLHLRDVVVSEMGKGWAGPNQVGPEETNESEPLMMCRKRIDDVKTMVESFLWDKCRRQPVYCLRGIRHESGVKSGQALVWNVGTCHSGVKGEAQVEAP